MLITNQLLGTSIPSGEYKAQVERSFKDLGFKMEWPLDLVSLEASTNLAAIFTGVTFSASYLSKTTGQENHSVSVPLATLAEHWAADDSVCRIERYANGSLKSIQFCVEIGVDGGLPMLDDETLEFTMRGLSTNAGFKLSVYGLEAPVQDYRMLKYDSLQVPASSYSKEFNVADASTIVFPRSTGAIVEMQLIFSNGRVCNYTEGELQLLSLSAQTDSVSGPNDESIESPGYSSNYVLDVKACERLIVKTNGTAYNCYSVGSVAIGKPSEAVKTAVNLVDTTTVKAERDAAIAEKK